MPDNFSFFVRFTTNSFLRFFRQDKQRDKHVKFLRLHRLHVDIRHKHGSCFWHPAHVCPFVLLLENEVPDNFAFFVRFTTDFFTTDFFLRFFRQDKQRDKHVKFLRLHRLHVDTRHKHGSYFWHPAHVCPFVLLIENILCHMYITNITKTRLVKKKNIQ